MSADSTTSRNKTGNPPLPRRCSAFGNRFGGCLLPGGGVYFYHPLKEAMSQTLFFWRRRSNTCKPLSLIRRPLLKLTLVILSADHRSDSGGGRSRKISLIQRGVHWSFGVISFGNKEISPCTLRKYTNRLVEMTGGLGKTRRAPVSTIEQRFVPPAIG